MVCSLDKVLQKNRRVYSHRGRVTECYTFTNHKLLLSKGEINEGLLAEQSLLFFFSYNTEGEMHKG